jgi:hypothetical protein
MSQDSTVNVRFCVQQDKKIDVNSATKSYSIEHLTDEQANERQMSERRKKSFPRVIFMVEFFFIVKFSTRKKSFTLDWQNFRFKNTPRQKGCVIKLSTKNSRNLLQTLLWIT